MANKRILTEITEKEYYKKSGDKKADISKLKKSVYPWQARNYILLKFTKIFPKSLQGKYVPVDYKLYNLIRFLWRKKIITMGWDQGVIRKYNKLDYSGFITMKHKTADKKNVLPILKKMFGEKKIIIFDTVKHTKLYVQPGKNTRENKMNKSKEYPKLVRIIIYSHMIVINFNHALLPWIHRKLNLDIPKKKNSLEGRRIISDFRKKVCNIIKL
jgi:hypothetical protein